MNDIIEEVLQHLDSSLSAKFDYSNVDESLNFLFRMSYDGKKISFFLAIYSVADPERCSLFQCPCNKNK